MAAANPSVTEIERQVERAAGVPRKVGEEVWEIPVSAIVPAAFNPRQHFDEVELQRLAESLQAHGQLQEIVVRSGAIHRGKDAWELIAGERRWRAAERAGLATLRARVITADDKTAVELAGIENYQREQLNAIEEARWFQSMIDTGGYTQEALAQRLGITQGQVSNRLRLLTLPPEWRGRVISGEMPATWARHLAPWVEEPGVMRRIEERWAKHRPDSESEFLSRLRQAVNESSRPLSGHVALERRGGWYHGAVAFKATPQERQALRCYEVPSDWAGKRSEPRAFNVELWDRLQAAGEARQKAREAKKAQKLEDGSRSPQAAAAEQRAKAQALREQHERRVGHWRAAWLQGRIVERLDQLAPIQALRLALFFITSDSGGRLCEALDRSIHEAGGKLVQKQTGYYRKVDTWPSLATVIDAELLAVATGAMKEWCSMPVEAHRSPMSHADVESVAGWLGVDPRKDWQPERDLRGFLDLHTSEQLRELVRQWGISGRVPGAQLKRGELIDAIVEVNPAGPPAALGGIAAGVSGGGKRKGGGR